MLFASPLAFREEQGDQKKSQKPSKDIYKASLKSTINSEQHFPRSLVSNKNLLLYILILLLQQKVRALQIIKQKKLTNKKSMIKEKHRHDENSCTS